MLKDVEDDVDELTDSDFSKAIVIVFYKIDNGKDCVLTSLRFVDWVEKIGECFHSVELAGYLWKLYPNESGNLEHFAFVRCYVYKEVSLESTEESELTMMKLGSN